jgi:hypothetical protein
MAPTASTTPPQPPATPVIYLCWAIGPRVEKIIPHRVRPGDLGNILANQYNTTVSHLEELNPGIVWKELKIGSTLSVPEGSQPQTKTVVALYSIFDREFCNTAGAPVAKELLTQTQVPMLGDITPSGHYAWESGRPFGSCTFAQIPQHCSV